MTKKMLAQRTCERCRGDRYVKQGGHHRICPACAGKGYVWVEYVLMDEREEEGQE